MASTKENKVIKNKGFFLHLIENAGGDPGFMERGCVCIKVSRGSISGN